MALKEADHQKKKVMKKMGTKKEKEEMKVDNIYQATEPYMKFIDEYHRETINKKVKKIKMGL